MTNFHLGLIFQHFQNSYKLVDYISDGPMWLHRLQKYPNKQIYYKNSSA